MGDGQDVMRRDAEGQGIRVDDSIATRHICITRVERKNAITNAMYIRLATAIDSAADDDAIASIVISAEGPLFTAGNDLGEFVSDPPLTMEAPVFAFIRALVRTPVAVIAAVRGAAVGIGTTMLLHCDFIYATPDASFRAPFVDIGLVPEAASSLLLPQLVGKARAAEMILLGKPMDARTAERLGLVTDVVEDSELQPTVLATAEALAKKPRAALRASKALLHGDIAVIEERVRHEREAVLRQFANAETSTLLNALARRK
jgi:enoyl-CoA hydratase/carnithine racemase